MTVAQSKAFAFPVLEWEHLNVLSTGHRCVETRSSVLGAGRWASHPVPTSPEGARLSSDMSCWCCRDPLRILEQFLLRLSMHICRHLHPSAELHCGGPFW